MKGLVFAAGRGSRLRPETDETPKPLLDVADEPLLSWCLRAITDAGVDEIVVVVGYRAAMIVDRFGDSFDGASLSYVHQTERKGLAHAVCTAEESLEDGDDVLCVNGDNVFEGDLSPLVDRHLDPTVDGTILLDRPDRNEGRSMARCAVGPDGSIAEVTVSSADGPVGTGFVAAGAQTHDSTALVDACRRVDRAATGEYELSDALELLIKDGNRYVGIEPDSWHLNVNTPSDLERAREHLRRA